MIVNLTPHTINLIVNEHHSVSLPPSGEVARVTSERDPSGYLEQLVEGYKVPTFRETLGAVSGLPDPFDGVIYVVSGLVAQTVRRPDVFSPGELVRNDRGQPVGCRGLTRYGV